MQIYLKGGCLNGFDGQKAFEAKHMAKNPWTRREHGEHDKNNIGHGGKPLAKG